MGKADIVQVSIQGRGDMWYDVSTISMVDARVIKRVVYQIYL